MTKTENLYQFDHAIESTMGVRVVGVDEAGRGPLAGPVMASAVCLDLHSPIDGLNDSKKLSAARREELYGAIVAGACGWAVGVASVEEIDRLNILQATFLAMQRALAGLSLPWTLALIDGNNALPTLALSAQLTVVHGDSKSASIAAASIVAKVTRDRMMEALHKQYPLYGFDRHHGYGTREHRQRLLRFGMCPLHRRSFCESILQAHALDLFSLPTAQQKVDVAVSCVATERETL